jgi:small subunit ribosomal protein S18
LPRTKEPKQIRKKVCKLCVEKLELMDYKDDRRLGRFITDRGKIVPRRISGTCARHQKQITLAVKRARVVALLPFTSDQLR